MMTFFSAILLALPGLAWSATEILLEPSGGKAILVESDLVVKRNSNIIGGTDNAGVEQTETKVDMRNIIILLFLTSKFRSTKEQQSC